MAELCVPIDWCSQKEPRVERDACVRVEKEIQGLTTTDPFWQISLQNPDRAQ